MVLLLWQLPMPLIGLSPSSHVDVVWSYPLLMALTDWAEQGTPDLLWISWVFLLSYLAFGLRYVSFWPVCLNRGSDTSELSGRYVCPNALVRRWEKGAGSYWMTFQSVLLDLQLSLAFKKLYNISLIHLTYLVEIFEVSFYKLEAKKHQLKSPKKMYLGFSVVITHFSENSSREPLFSNSSIGWWGKHRGNVN